MIFREVADLYKNEEVAERVILVGVSEHDGDDTMDSLNELKELVKTAGADAVATVVQNRQMIHPLTYVGTGKVEEIRQLLAAYDATGIVCDDELSPAQLKNLEDMLHTKIMDRTLIILDIFASRASTSEGKIQVELAQLKYRLTRLTGLGRSMSRLGGGIGTRGPGEKKLEMDKRFIKARIAQLNRELKEVEKHRQVTRGQRERSSVPVAAIVGYTNAGKSTLLNRLTDAGVMEEDKLFATLDPTTRLLELSGHQQLLLTDTVGFIRKLPHHLIDAFRSTLEEAKYADFILHVVDVSNPQVEKQMHIVYETLENLKITNETVITLFNKQDRLKEQEPMRDGRADRTLKISAKTGEGLEDLKELLRDVLRENKQCVELLLPYRESGTVDLIHKKGEVISQEYKADGIRIKAFVPSELVSKLYEKKITLKVCLEEGGNRDGL